MRYRCRFLNEDDQVVRVEELNSYDDGDAHRGAMSLLTRIGGFSGFELWREGRKVDEYRPVKPGGAPDPRCDELEARLCGLAPADELAYSYLYRDHSAHCRRDPAWRERIAELEAQLDVDGLARALTLAADLTWTLADKL
jgi:hypothetical protein